MVSGESRREEELVKSIDGIIGSGLGYRGHSGKLRRRDDRGLWLQGTGKRVGQTKGGIQRVGQECSRPGIHWGCSENTHFSAASLCPCHLPFIVRQK